MKSKLIAPGTERLKLKLGYLLSNLGFNFNLRRYTPEELQEVALSADGMYAALVAGAGHSCTSRPLLVHFSPQRKHFLRDTLGAFSR